MNIRVIIVSFILLFSSHLFARENTDVIVMKNGDRLTCQIKGLSAGVLSVSLSYVDGTVGLRWSEVARLESNQLLLVQTESGAVYTGKLSTTATPGDQVVRIQVVSAEEREIDVSQSQLVKMNQTGENFWRRLDGAINTGIVYSKGNQSTQYNIASQVEYRRERWYAQGSYNSNLSASSGANVSTRNQIDLSAIKLLRRNNWFYSGAASFLQSSVQGINLETTLGGGIGRYLWNNDRESFYVLGGLAWQNAQYKNYTAGQGAQNAASALFAADLRVFRFKKTSLDASAGIFPGISEPGRVRTNTNATYYIKLINDLSWNLSFYGNWDNQPPSTFSGSDYGTSSGLTFKFGNR
jgi:hypothetical protein